MSLFGKKEDVASCSCVGTCDAGSVETSARI